MKYYASFYKGNIDVYNTETMQKSNNPYKALKMANEEWNMDSDKQIARLLILIRKSDSADDIIIDDKAYFQFTDTNACIKFADNQIEIIWSNDNNQQWNGNAKIMG